MYFIRYSSLKERLKNRSIDDREALPYLILFCVLEAIATALPGSDYKNRWDYISTGVTLLITIWGVIYAYQRNGGRNGYDLIHKFVILGWVVAVRYLIGVVPIFIAVFALAWHYDFVGDESTLFAIILFSVLEIIFYQRIGRHIADTNKNPNEQVTQTT